MKKIERNLASEENWISVLIIDITIGILILAAVVYVFYISQNFNLEIATIACILMFFITYIVRATVYVHKYDNKYEGIKKLILIDEDGVYKKEWNIDGKASLLIGKNTRSNEVDIDLADTEYSYLISKQHATLNFASNNWYLEDIGSSNGVGIKKLSDNIKRKLYKDVPYKLDLGDVIYIANTKLIIK
jgi:hypothetical protein